MSTTALIIADKPAVPVFSVAPVAPQLRDEALSAAALIGKVENAAQNNACTVARRSIKGLLSMYEAQRKTLKEPILEAGRQLDRIVAAEVEELKREDGRLENLEKDFIRAELRRKAEEEELQRKELARIEAERQAELKRIADEQAAELKRIADAQAAEAKRAAAAQAEIDRKAREAAAEAAKLAAEATNKKQREAAAKAAQDAAKAAEEAEQNRQAVAAKAAQDAAKAAAEAQAKADQQTQLVEQRADDAAYIESRPVETTRSFGQSVRKKWKITRINDFQLMKARPDLVRKVEWDMVALNQALSSGEKLPGVEAVEDFSINHRAGKPVIELKA